MTDARELRRLQKIAQEKSFESEHSQLDFDNESIDDMEESELPPIGWSPKARRRSCSANNRRRVSISVKPTYINDGCEGSDTSDYDGSNVDFKDEFFEYLGEVYAAICDFCALLLKLAAYRSYNIFSIFVMLFVVFYFSSPPSIGPPLSFADQVKRDVFPQNELFGRALLLIGQRISNPPPNSEESPLAFTMVAANQAQINNATKIISTLMSLHFPQMTIERISTFSDGTPRDEVRSLIHSILLDTNGNAIIVMDHVDSLQGTSPLALQTLTDKDNAFYKNPVFITLLVDEEAFSVPLTRKQCTIAVERILKTAWTSGGLSEDQASPIVSRLTTFNICLSPETF